MGGGGQLDHKILSSVTFKGQRQGYSDFNDFYFVNEWSQAIH